MNTNSLPPLPRHSADGQPAVPRARKVQIAIRLLLLTVLVGLIFGAALFLVCRHAAKGGSNARYMLADQGYSGNSAQKLIGSLQEDPQIAQTVEAVRASVVTIVVDITENGQAGQGLGSGVVLRDSGDRLQILTNAHVVNDADRIYLYLPSSSELIPMQLSGADVNSDLAVVSLDKSQLPAEVRDAFVPATLGDSDALRTGQTAIAIGSPQSLAYENSVTVGVVSYPKREMLLAGTSSTYIQTDVAVNPGNSGGALFDIEGRVIGIISNKIALTDVEGIAFAIPINHAREIAHSLMDDGTLQSLTLGGITECTFLTASMASLYHVPSGLSIQAIRPGSSADTQGLRAGDLITHIDGCALESMEDVNTILLSHEEGDVVTVTAIRSRNADEPFTVEIQLEALQESSGGSFWNGAPQ